jgi:hypothetical protein
MKITRNAAVRVFGWWFMVATLFCVVGPVVLGWPRYEDWYQRTFAIGSVLVVLAIGVGILRALGSKRGHAGAIAYVTIFLCGSVVGAGILVATQTPGSYDFYWLTLVTQFLLASSSAITIMVLVGADCVATDQAQDDE